MLTQVVTAQSGTSIQLNPDGTHSVTFESGPTSIQVNPDGTHSVIFHNGSTSTQVNPDGSHSVIFHNGPTSTQVNPDGTHTVSIHQENSTIQVNSDGTHSIFHWFGKGKHKKQKWTPAGNTLVLRQPALPHRTALRSGTDVRQQLNR